MRRSREEDRSSVASGSGNKRQKVDRGIDIADRVGYSPVGADF